MIEKIETPHSNVVAFSAKGEVTAENFKDVLIPAVKSHMETNDVLNYVLYLDTDISNFTTGAWLQDAKLGLQQFTNWNRSVIFSDKESVKKFTEVFSKIMPGEFRVYPHDEEEEGLRWVSEKSA